MTTSNNTLNEYPVLPIYQNLLIMRISVILARSLKYVSTWTNQGSPEILELALVPKVF